MSQSTTQRALVFIGREFLLELLYWPIWWYSRGLVLTAGRLWSQVLGMAERLSIRILVKNIFRPMYSDYTRSGRIISFFFRVILIVTRSAVLAVWMAVCLILLLIWAAGPVVAAAMFVRQLVPV